MSHYKVYTVHIMFLKKVQIPTLDGFRGNVVLGSNTLRWYYQKRQLKLISMSKSMSMGMSMSMSMSTSMSINN